MAWLRHITASSCESPICNASGNGTTFCCVTLLASGGTGGQFIVRRCISRKCLLVQKIYRFFIACSSESGSVPLLLHYMYIHGRRHVRVGCSWSRIKAYASGSKLADNKKLSVVLITRHPNRLPKVYRKPRSRADRDCPPISLRALPLALMIRESRDGSR